jgi:hypothetical protein
MDPLTEPDERPVSENFELILKEVPEKRRLYVIAKGPLDSERLASEQIALLSHNRYLLSYDRIVDINGCVGHMNYADIQRFGAFLATAQHAMAADIGMAMITKNPFIIARLPLASLYYHRHIVRAFDTLEAGEAWLDERLKI